PVLWPTFFLFLYRSPTPAVLPPFPTRRSSDLHLRHRDAGTVRLHRRPPDGATRRPVRWRAAPVPTAQAGPLRAERVAPRRAHQRSEEHTSELQSRENLVCRLLLEKKNVH